MLDNKTNEPSKFRTEKWVEINDDAHGVHGIGSRIRFTTSVLKSSLCDYSDAYILVSGKITIIRAGDTDAKKRTKEINKDVIFKNCTPSIEYTNKINNTQINHAEDLDIMMPMYNLIE